MRLSGAVTLAVVWFVGCNIPDDARPSQDRAATLNVITKPELAPAWAIRYGEELWRRPSTDAGTGIDLQDVIDRVSHAISRDGDGMPGVRSQHYVAAFDGIGLRIAPRGHEPEHSVHTSQITVDDHVEYAGTGTSEWSVLGNTAQTLRTPQIVEHYEATRDGVELAWVLREPVASDVTVVVAIDDGVQVGPAELVDARGQRWPVTTETVPGGLRWRIGADLLAQATYPVALDPLISAELTVDDVVYANSLDSQQGVSVTANANGYFVAWDDNDNRRIAATRVTPSGTVLDPAGISIEGFGGGFAGHVGSNGTDFLMPVGFFGSDGMGDLGVVRINASGVLDPTLIRVVQAPESQGAARIASNGTDYLMVWTDRRPTSPNTFANIYAARITAAGTVLDPNGFVVTNTAADQIDVSVASDGTNYMVVWQESDPVLGGFDVYGSRVTSAGAASAPFPISTAAGVQGWPRIAFNGSEYLVVWHDERNGTDRDIYGARLATNGTVTDSNGIAIATGSDVQQVPSVASNGTDFLVSWDSFDGVDYDVYASRVTAAGAVVDTTGIAIATNTREQRVPAVGSFGSDYLIAYQSLAFGFDIRSARVTSTGMVLGADTPLALSSNEYKPAIASNGTNYLVTWQDGRNYDLKGFDIYGARLSATGAMLDPAGLALSSVSFDQTEPSVASNGTDYLVAWQDKRAGTNANIYATRVTSGGTIVDTGGLAVSTAADEQVAPAVASNGTDYLVAWQDHRNGTDDDLYAARITATGTNLDTSGIVVAAEAGAQAVPTAASNGSNYMLAWEDTRSGSNAFVYAGRLSATGSLLDASGFPVSGSARAPALASNGTNYLVAWDTTADVFARRISSSGVLQDSSAITVSAEFFPQKAAAVASNGIDYVVTWQDQRIGQSLQFNDIYACRITPSGTVVDPTGAAIQISGNGVNETAPAIAFNRSNGKFVVAYESSDRIRARLVTFCGDGATEASETCDDGNSSANDGCSPQCLLEPGFVCSGIPSFCIDINECDTSNGGCAQVCNNTPGSFSCACNTGYALNADGHSCDDIDECATNNGGCAGTCTNSTGSYTCSCPAGYMLGSDGHACDDINECATNNGGCAQVCNNTAGSFSCACNTGFTLNADGHSCNDVDECATNNGGCAGTCTNSSGSYTCSCPAGYMLGSDGHACTDIDECATANGGCAQVCTNTTGSFSCGCNTGFTLNADGHTCDDVDECATNNGGCAGACTNLSGSYTCSCPAGFMVGGDGHTCVDVDECATANGGCSQVCTNSAGAFVCSCTTGFELAGDGVTCTAIDPCVANPDDNNCQGNDDDQGCGCRTTTPSQSALWLLVIVLGLRRRRR